MKNQKSRRINRKQTKRKTTKRKTIKRKTTKRKTIKRKTTKRKTTKRKQNKKIVYNQKKMYGGKFNPDEEEILKKSLERFNFNEEELEEVIKILGYGGHYLSGNNLIQLTSQYQHLNIDDFLEWLSNEHDGYMHAVEDDETDNEDEDEDEYEDEYDDEDEDDDDEDDDEDEDDHEDDDNF